MRDVEKRDNQVYEREKQGEKASVRERRNNRDERVSEEWLASCEMSG